MANIFDRPQHNPARSQFGQIEDIARQSRVPVNVLLTLAEQAGADTPEKQAHVARRAAQEFGPKFQGATDATAVVRELAGDQADSFLARAREIGQQLYPERMQAAAARRQEEAAALGRRSAGENLRLGLPQYAEGWVSGAGRVIQTLGFDESGNAIVDFAERQFGQDEDEQARSAAIAESSTIPQEIWDGFLQAAPGILVDVAASVAGAVAGAKAGAKVGAMAGAPAGPGGVATGAGLGGLIGGVAGAAASIFPQMVASAWNTAEQNDWDTNDPEIQTRILFTALATSVAQTLFPAGVSQFLTRPLNLAAQGAARSMIGRAGAGAAIGAGTEGMAEVAALFIEQIMWDRDIQEGMDENDWRVVGPMLVEKFGREAVVTFGIGALMGGGIGAPTGAADAARLNRQVGRDQAQIPPVMEGVWAQATEVDPGSVPGVPRQDHSAFLRGVLNELNGTEFALSRDADGDPTQGRTARQQRAYEKGVAWARERGGDVAEGIRTKAEAEAEAARPTAAVDDLGGGQDEADDLAPPEPKPGSLSHAAMEGARRAGIPEQQQQDTGPVVVSPQAGMPGGDPIASEAGDAGPQPQEAATGQQIPVWMQMEGERDAMPGQIVAETEAGLQVMDDETGEVYDVPREDIEAGLVQITPREAGQSIEPEAPADQQAEPETPDDITVEEARRRLQVLEDQARDQGWDRRMREIRDDLRAIIDRQEADDARERAQESEVETPEATEDAAPPDDAAPMGELGAGTQGAPDAATAPDTITKADGGPYKSKAALKRKITQDGLDPDAYDIQERDGGFIAVAKSDAAPEAPDVQQTAQQEPKPTAAEREIKRLKDKMMRLRRDKPGSEELRQAEADLRRARQNAFAEDGTPQEPTPPSTEGETTDGIQQEGQQEGLRQQGREEEVTADDTPGEVEVPQVAAPPPARAPTVAPMDAERAKARRRDMNRAIDAIEANTAWQGMLEGRTVIVRPGKVRVRVDGRRDNDLITETEGMDRDEVETWLSGAIQQAERMAPSVAGRDPVTAALNTAIERGQKQHTTRKGKTLTGYVVRGITPEQGKAIDPYGFNKDGGFFVRADRADAFEGVQAPRRADDTPTAEQIDQAAQETDPDPTPAQAEAENYRTGKIDWRGLTLSIENRKGTERRGVDAGGNEWSVTMPAHYGRILRTEGADGDHVDFYMGDDAYSDRVFVVDQKDAETGAFDEHKVMLGFGNQQKAKEAYLAGFSDGKGRDRWGGVTAMSVADLGQIINDRNRWQRPFKMKEPAQESDAKPETREMTTDDGYRVEWDEKGTTIFHPRGPGISSTMRQLTDAEVNEYLDDVRRPEVDARIQAKFPAKYQTKAKPETDKQRLIRLFKEAVQSGDQGRIKAARDPLMRLIGEPATMSIEVDALGLRDALDAANEAVPDGFSIRLEVPGFAVYEGTKRTGISGLNRTVAGIHEAERLAKRLADSKPKSPTWADFDERSDNDPKMPAGYELTLIRRMTKQEAEAEGYQWPAYKAAVKRDRPAGTYKVESGISENSRSNAIAVALERAKKGADKAQAEPAAPSAASIDFGGADVSERAVSLANRILDVMKDAARVQVIEGDVGKSMSIISAVIDARNMLEAELGSDLFFDVDQQIEAAYEAERDRIRAERDAKGMIAPPSKKQEAPSASSILDQAFDDVFGDEQTAPDPQQEATPAQDAPAEAQSPEEAYDLTDEAEREAMLVAGGMKPAAAKKAAAKDFNDLSPAQKRAVERGAGAPRTAGEAASSAAQNIAGGAADIVAGLNALFGDPNKLSAGLTFDPETYAKAKPLFISAVRKFGQAGQDIIDIARAMVRGLRAEGLQREAQENMRPYLERFISDVQSGAVDPFSDAPASDTMEVSPQTETPQDDQRSDPSPDRASPAEGEGDPAPRQGQADGTRRGSDEPGGAESGLRPDGDGRPGRAGDAARDGAAGRAGRADQQLGARDHIIEPGGLTLARGEKTRARESIAALRTLRTIQAEGRTATADERAALAKYGGAGTLAGTLPRSDGSVKYPDLAAEIDALLSPEEKATLSRTSQYAFYTAESALRGMWNLARQLGFDGGRVYEPGMGVGGFAGTIPADVRDRTSYQGLELDLVTAQIAQALYPRQAIQQGDFTRTPLPQNYYDLVIGNPPFSATKIQNDPAYPQRFMIHDYFFAKSLDAVRPGGLLLFITSAGTMNKQDSTARDYLADRADLVGAIRLPNTAFKENGTEVTTDIIVLRKRAEGETEASPTWREAVRAELPDGEGGTGQAFVNRYFLDNPDMILGEQGLYDTLTAGARVGVRPKPGADLKADLARVAQSFPRDIMSDAAPSTELGAIDAESPETKRGGFYIKDSVLHQFDGSAGVQISQRSKANPKGLPKADHERVMALVPIKLALRDVYAADLDGRDATAARKALNEAYDAFVEKFGPINKEVRTERAPSRVQIETARQRAAEDARSRGEPFDIGSFDAGPMIESGAKMAEIARARAEAMTQPGYREGDFDPKSVPDTVIIKRPNIDPFIGNKDRLGDQEGYRLRSIEKYNSETGEAKKTPIFTEPAVRKTKQPTINSPEDALLFTLAERGRIDISAIAKLAKVSEESALSDLQGKIFRNPETGQYETRAKYLSGNVRRKLKEAQEAAKSDPAYNENVRQLLEVQPEPIPASEIRVPVGAHWFDPSIYGQYARSKGLQLTAEFQRSLGIWTVDGDTKSAEARNDWGTEDVPFADLMRLIMNNKTIQVKRTHKNPDGSTETTLDETATQAAQDKAQEIRADFSQWFWSDEARAEQMEALYNETFNAEVAPEYDGGYLTTPGVNSGWSWRPHQSSVIARILQSGSTYMAHTVGAGKTSAMIGAGMEARRLGLARKPMYVVPNHMLDQFSKEFYEQYPLANVAIADESRFHTTRRKEFVADIAMNDYDAVVITHSAFELIPPSEAAVTLAVQDMLSDVREVYDASSAGDHGIYQALLGSIRSIAGSLGVDVKQVEGQKMNTRKKIEQLLEAAEQRIQRQTSTAKKDQVFTFDEIGVDMMFIDEAHLFRKLSFATQNGNIKGIDPNGSAASMDLFIKTRTVDQNNPGRGLILASGTPITNTMAELFSLSRYIQPQALEERGVSSFDAWASTFGMTDTQLEQDPAGGYKQVTRFSKFVNTPELSLMVRQVMDIVSSADLEQYVTRPAIKGGKRNLVVVEPSPEVKAYQQSLAARMEIIAQRKGPVKKGDDILLSVINDGRLAAIDMRLVDPNSTGQGSKLEMAIQNIYRKWKEGENAPLHDVKKEGGYTGKPVMRGPSTQIVFSTLGVNPSKHNPGFSVHRFIRSELIRMGVPAADIVLAEDLNSHGKRQRAFNDMNEGKKRILIGSKTLFTGVNAQKRIAAIHNLDPLWYPADDEQRNGRGIRQGNMNPEIEIFDYSTKGTYDATMWQMMGRKAAFIEAFYRGDPTVREMEDLGEASQFEQAKAMTTADPRVQELTDMKAERDKLRRRKSAASSQRRRLEQQERNATRAAETQEADLSTWDELAAQVEDTKGDAFTASVGDATFDNRTDAGNALISEADNLLADPEGPTRKDVGRLGGFPVQIRVSRAAQTTTFVVPMIGENGIDVGWSIEPVGLVRRIENAVQGIKGIPAKMRAEIAAYREKASGFAKARSKLKDFADQDRLDTLEDQIDTLEAEMLADAETERQADRESRFSEPVADTSVNQDAPAQKPMQSNDVQSVTRAMNSEMKRSGLEGKVTAKVVRGLMGAAGRPIQGRQRGAQIELNPDSADGVIGTLRHEIVHALRDAGLWGQPYGLFTRAEWQGLVAAARADKALMERVKRLYPKLSETRQLEEGVAELYRLWARNMDQRSGLDRAFQKMRAFFQALANALRGAGFQSDALTFERMASGRIGGRGPDGPSGRGRRDMREQRAFHGTPHDFDRFSTDFMGAGEGAQAFGWGLYFAGRRGIAEGYKKTLSASQKAVTIDGVRHSDGGRKSHGQRTAQERAVVRLSKSLSEGMDISHAIQWAKNDVRQAESGDLTEFQRSSGWGDVAKLREVVTILEGWRDAQIEDAPGRLFEVEIPDDDKLMSYDDKVKDQPKHIIEALDKLIPGGVNLNGTGWQAYSRLSIALGGDRQASLALRDAGIPGHRFLDQPSRKPDIFTPDGTDVSTSFSGLSGSMALSEALLDVPGIEAMTDADYEVATDDLVNFMLDGVPLSTEQGTRLWDMAQKAGWKQKVRDDATYNYVIYDDAAIEVMGKESRKPDDPRKSIRQWNEFVPTSVVGFVNLLDAPEAQGVLDQIAAAPDMAAAEKAADKWVLARGKAEGVEHMIAFDQWGGAIAIGRGHKSGVAFPPALMQALRDGSAVYFTHNHPRNSGFSAADLSHAIFHDFQATAMGHKGAVVSGRRGPIASEWRIKRGVGSEMVGEAIADIHGAVKSVFDPLVSSGEMPIDTANAVFSHVVDMAMHRHQIADIRSNGFRVVEKHGVDAEALLSQADERIRDALKRNRLPIAPVRDQDRDQPPGGTARSDRGGASASGVPARDGGEAQRAGSSLGGPEGLRESRFDITQTKAFRDWFGDSKVVDAEGKPLVVYHGTNADFEAFDSSRKGSHFGTKLQATERGNIESGQQIIPAYLAIKNPKRVKDTTGWVLKVKQAKEEGHDGIVYLNRVEGVDTDAMKGYSSTELMNMSDSEFKRRFGGEDSYIAFSPTQIKSVFNSGTFNPSDPRISESRFDPARRPDGRFATKAGEYSKQLLADGGRVTGEKERSLLGQFLTDMMGGKSDRYNTLALVPGEPLFQELGKYIPSAQKYLRMKHALSAMRNERQASAARLMDEWRGFMTRNKASNTAMMNLMHDATIAGVDPAEPITLRPRRTDESKAAYADYVSAREATYDDLKLRFNRLPKKAQDIYRQVRDAYQDVAATERGIVLDNVAKAMEINLERAKRRFDAEMRQIEEDGLTGSAREAAEQEARERLAKVRKRDGYGKASRLKSLRLMFESNEVDKPYFPLMRHGNYYATVTDAKGKVVSFSKFESERAQKQALADLRRAYPDHEIKVGTMGAKDGRGPEVDPNFLADVTELIGAKTADTELMDQIWQKYLETLPDFSIRKSRIHRKGTPGFTGDAFRNYARQTFHSAHQLARLKYGQDMQLAIEDARREADQADDPNRAVLVVNEMEKRHQWVMNPQTSAWSTWATSAAFVYYLGATPGAALVNLSQSVIVGIPVLSAAFPKGTINGASRHMMRALREFGLAKGRLLNSKHLKADEKAALQAAYDAGVIEKSQAHDLAGIAETGVEYSDIRARLMRPIAWMFHHSERMNREMTFIAAFRMARENGMGRDEAYTNAARLTWKSHFNYESDSRPRLQFNDTMRVATVFRNFQLNMLYRLFRDTHQSLHGVTEADKKEARAQLIGITGMMMLMAGFSGVWGYALMTTLVGLFKDGGADEVEEEIKEALVNTLGRDMAGMILKGVPGHLTGTDLSMRIGMPELWFRRAQRQEEGQELYEHWLEQLMGAVPAMGSNVFRGYSMAKEGEVWRGVETASPKFIRDWMRSARYARDGVTTFRGNPIIEDISPQEALIQAIGFTPARVSERYQTNRFMVNEEQRLRRRRSRLLAAAYDDIKDGGPLSARTRRDIEAWNAEFPHYPISAQTLRQSFQSRARGEMQTVDGVRINQRLDQQIREGRAPLIYN